MITVYTLVYNEEFLMQFMIDHWRSRFPDCHIVFYDNSSTDKTVEIAKENNCEVRPYNSNNTLNDDLHAKMKNEIWKDAKTDWVFVGDLDELVDINAEQLANEEKLGNTKIKIEGWEMVNMFDNDDVENIKHGYRSGGYDKECIFNKKFIKSVSFGVGCHSCTSTGLVKFSKPYRLFHYKSINPDRVYAKAAATVKRLSDINKKNGWGGACFRTKQQIIDDFNEIRKKSTKIRD